MIENLEISGQHTTVTPELKKYVQRKIGKLDRYASRHARKSVRAEVKLKESKAKDKKQFTCSVVLYLPKETLDASETTVNMFAAVDIVEAKLRVQLRKYKDTHVSSRLRRRFVARIRRQSNS